MARRRVGAVLVAALAAAAVWGTASVIAQQDAQGVDFTAVAGQQFTKRVATFVSGSPAEDFDVLIVWGDGTESAGTVSQLLPCSYPDANCYEVRGTHTYATQGIYTVQTDVAGPDGGAGTESTAIVTRPPSPPPPPPPPAGAALEILGPDELRLGEPARFIARAGPNPVRYRWDLDGDGQHETDAGGDPAIDHGFRRGGRFTVGARVTLADGRTLTATHPLLVRRPPLLGLEFSPANPKPGQRIRFRLRSRTERGTGFRLFSWRFQGARPLRRSVLLPARRRGRRAGDAQLIRLGGAQPTLKPRLSRSFAKRGVYPIEVRAIDEQGRATLLHASVNVGKGSAGRPYRGGQVLDCDKPVDPKWGACAAFHVYPSEPAAGVTTMFTDATPGAKGCIPTGVTLHKAKTLGKLQQALDLPYPSPGQFGGPQLAPQQAAAAGRRARSAKVDQDCVEAESETVEWDFGDGTKLSGAQLGGSKIASHTYEQPGTYKVSLVSRMPYFTVKKAAKKAASYYQLNHVLARKTETIEVLDTHCGVLHLNGIPATSVPDDGDVLGAKGCFYARKDAGGKGLLYQPLPGYSVDLNTVRVTTSGNPGAKPAPLVDPAAARVIKAPGYQYGLRATYGDFVVGQFPWHSQYLQVPKPAFDKELNAQVAALPASIAFGPPVGGLPAQSIQVSLAKSRGAFARLFLRLPKPLNAGLATAAVRPVIVGGGPKALLSAVNVGEPTDLSLDLSDVKLGFFELEKFELLHGQASGHWFGGGNLRVPALDLAVLAEYKPETGPTSGDCDTVDGPSGIELDGDGGFLHGGAIVKAPIAVGPLLKFTCLALRGSKDPFALVGKAKADIPAATGIFNVNGCFFIAVKWAGDSPGCGAPKAEAGKELTWFRAQADLRIRNALTLGSGYLDLRKGTDLLEVRAGGKLDESVGVGPLEPYAEGSVKGALVFEPKFGFHLLGKVSLGIEVDDPAPDPPEISVQGGVSTKGFGACGWIGGFVYYWSGGADAWLGGGCDLEHKIGVAAAFLQPTSLAGPLASSAQPAAARRLRLPAGMRKVGLRVHGEGGAPIVSVRGPRGRRVVDDGGAARRGRGFSIVHGPEETVVTIERPPGGAWRVEARAGSPRITRVDVLSPLAEPRVGARLRGRGRARVLTYRAKLARGDRFQLLEEGRAVTRQLGRARGSGRGRIRIRGGSGSPGRRTIFAIVERRGISYKRIQLASYRVPRPPRARGVRGLRALVVRGRLRVDWRRARGARRYRVSVRLSDRRVLSFETRRRHAVVPSVGAGTRGRVEVVAIGADGRDGGRAGVRLRPERPKRARVRL